MADFFKRRHSEIKAEGRNWSFWRSKWFVFLMVGLIIATILALSFRDGVEFACSLAGDNYDHCIKYIATSLDLLPLCDSIEGGAFKTFVNGKEVQLENPPRMACISEIAANRNDIGLCNKVEGFLISHTRIDCLYDVALENRESSACRAIGSESQSRMGRLMNRENCLALVK